jgi:hypothetical protein
MVVHIWFYCCKLLDEMPLWVVLKILDGYLLSTYTCKKLLVYIKKIFVIYFAPAHPKWFRFYGKQIWLRMRMLGFSVCFYCMVILRKLQNAGSFLQGRFYVFKGPRANLTMGPYDYIYIWLYTSSVSNYKSFQEASQVWPNLYDKIIIFMISTKYYYILR